MRDSQAAGSRRGITPLGIIFAVLGLVLFAYLVKRAGVSQILEGINRLGSGFLIVLAISSLRQVARCLAWKLCMEQPHRLRFWDAFRARVMGDAIGNILPFASFVISEPAKPALIRDRVPFMAGFSAIVIENMFYGLSVASFILLGMISFAFRFCLSKGLRFARYITFAGLLLLFALWALLI